MSRRKPPVVGTRINYTHSRAKASPQQRTINQVVYASQLTATAYARNHKLGPAWAWRAKKACSLVVNGGKIPVSLRIDSESQLLILTWVDDARVLNGLKPLHAS